VLEKADVAGGRFLFFFLCTLGFSLCQHKILAEVSLLTSGCAVVLAVLRPVWILSQPAFWRLQQPTFFKW